jgi:hypothetical protein
MRSAATAGLSIAGVLAAVALVAAGCGGSDSSVGSSDQASYRDGQTHHFVELTPTGQLIRAQ